MIEKYDLIIKYISDGLEEVIGENELYLQFINHYAEFDYVLLTCRLN